MKNLEKVQSSQYIKYYISAARVMQKSNRTAADNADLLNSQCYVRQLEEYDAFLKKIKTITLTLHLEFVRLYAGQ